MGNFYKDNDDLRFYMDKWIPWEPLVDLTEYMGRAKDSFKTTDEAVEFYGDILDLIGQFIADDVAPHTEEIDRQGVDFIDGEAVLPERQSRIFEQIKALEIHGMCLPRELGGQNCPLLVYHLGTEIFSRADVSVAAHHGFHGGIAMAMLLFSIREGTTVFDAEQAQITETRFSSFIEEIRQGNAWGCMDITEPDAGSDMGRLRCSGDQDKKGNWTVTGQKIFITSGHGKYHFVIARTEPVKDENDPFSGLNGLSMFLVPAYEEDKNGNRSRFVDVIRLEEKLGHHGSATCALAFDKAPAYLIGKRGEGFQYMLTLMNNARVGVGFESLGLCEAAHRLAKAYAAERKSMGKTIDRHEMIADMLSEMETDTRAIRALAMHGGYHEEMAQKIGLLVNTGYFDAATGTDPKAQAYRDQLKSHKYKARRATPLLKYLASEKAVEMARRCVQIHGGVGYTRDYGAEKLLRDAMVMPIYEGTSQIQSLMAMKDTLGGIMKEPQRFIKRVAQARWRAMSAQDPLERRVAKLQAISLSAQQALLLRTAKDKVRGLSGEPLSHWPDRFFKDWNPKRDFAFAMLHAERLTKILIDELVCECLWEQARAYPERRIWLERYLTRAEPRCRFLADEIKTTGDQLLAELADEDIESEAIAG